MSKVLVPLLAAALLAACATPARKPVAEAAPAPVAAAVVAPAAAPAIAADDNLNAVAWTQTAVEHDLVYRQAFHAAGEKLLKALKDRSWDALSREDRTNAFARLKPAVIVDIDETMLDNSPYQARLVRDGASYDEFTWAQWCREKTAKPMPGALEFAQLAAKHGVTVFYLSNRSQDLNEATVENLRAAGFPLASDEVFLGLGTVVPGCEQVGSEKGCRRQLVGREHRVLLQLGDQLGDFLDVLVNTPDGRRTAVAPYLDWVGERWFVLPNPTYGSWQPALFNNEWSRPAAERRQATLDALRYH
ncbi:MAG: acid phosphatase [Rhodanobacteraceae bacterium]|jgi:acid phosphatase|nr:acid phosphatase [Rhodanobacteraceae bacterium]